MAEIPNPFEVPARVYSAQEEARKLAAQHAGKPGATKYYLQAHAGNLDGSVDAENVMKMGSYVNP